MSIKRKKIIFETIRPVHFLLVKYFLWRGYPVSVFQFVHNDTKPKWLLRMLSRGMVERIFVPTVSCEDALSIDQTEVIFERLKDFSVGKILIELFGDSEIDLIFKRAISDEIFKAMYINDFLASEIIKADNLECVYFIPLGYIFYSTIIGKYSNYALKRIDRVIIPVWACALGLLFRLCDRFKYVVLLLGYALIIALLSFLGKIRGCKENIPAHYKFAISLPHSSGIGTLRGKAFDFLLDHGQLNKKNTVFLLSAPAKNDRLIQLRHDGYNIVDIREHQLWLSLVDSGLKLDFVWPVLRATFEVLKKAGTQFPVFAYAFFCAIRAHVNSRVLFSRVAFDNYIFTHQESLAQIAFNLMLRQKGGKTWNYHLFIGGGVLYVKDDDFNNYRQRYWAFLNNDYSVLLSKNVIRYNQLHRQKVREYFDVGCIYSQLVCESVSKEKKATFVQVCFPGSDLGQSKIISFFDTTFIPSENSVTSYSDAINFYADINRLLAQRNNLLVIIKPSKSAAWFTRIDTYWCSVGQGRRLTKLFDILKSNPRVFWAGEQADTTAIMAHSDLVVTHCMSSPTVEALGARKKAIWYESGNKHCGIMYDRIPGLVVHGYEALEKRIDELLYKMTEEEYGRYLDEEIKGKVESYLDGKALTRFRQLLTTKG